MSAPVTNEAQAAPIQPVAAEPAPAAAPVTDTKPATAPAPGAATGGPIDQDDVKRWTDRANDILARPSEHLNSSSAPGAQPWYAGFFDCFNPVDSCLITCCVPCVTFGKAHHRIHKDPSLKGYEPVNTSVSTICIDVTDSKKSEERLLILDCCSVFYFLARRALAASACPLPSKAR